MSPVTQTMTVSVFTHHWTLPPMGWSMVWDE